MLASAWDHLPNAKHIDRVIASLKEHDVAWGAAMYAARDAWSVAWDAARNAAQDAARDVAWDSARNAAQDAAGGAILALIAWDDCGYMIESGVGELRILAAFGDQRALLLLPACIVYHKTIDQPVFT